MLKNLMSIVTMISFVASRITMNLLRPQHVIRNAIGTRRAALLSTSAFDRIFSILDDNRNTTNVKNRNSFEELSKRLCEEYERLPSFETNSKSESCRRAIINLLASELGTRHEAIMDASVNYTTLANDSDLPMQRAHLADKLLEACTPEYDRIFRYMLAENAQVGMRFFVRLRQDLLLYKDILSRTEKNDDLRAHLKQLDSSLRLLLASWFSSEALEIRRITYETTSAAIVETIATKEAVHPVRSLDDLRSRLGPDKRVYCAFHPLLPNEPLIFVHVALRQVIPDSMDQVWDADMTDPTAARVATFYSISSTQPGLSGVDLGQILIKKAIGLLQRELPSLDTFVTLSPIPRFRSWIRDKLLDLNRGGKFLDAEFISHDDLDFLRSALKCGIEEDVIAHLLKALEDPWDLMSLRSLALEPILMKLAARYLIVEKHRRKPLDGVARFHIQNGAEVFRLNYMADASRKGIHNSLGVMVNYRYDLEKVETNRQEHEDSSTMPVQEDVMRLIQQSVNTV